MAAGATIQTSISGFTVNFTLVPSSGSIVSAYWRSFGDGTGLVYGTSVSHTYTEAGSYSVYVSYTDGYADSYGATTTVKIGGTDDPDIGDVIEDAFKTKPIIIPAECTGSISITASIGDLEKPDQKYDESSGRTIEPYINFASIVVPGNSSLTFILDKDTTTSTTFTGVGSVSDAKLENLGNIPAFYNSGLITLEFKVSESGDEGSLVDLMWDVFMDFPDAQTLCPWSEGNYATDGQMMKNLITSSNSETFDPNMVEYTNYTRTFSIQKWSQLPPFVIKEFVDEPATTIMVKRAMLADPRIHLRVTNNLAGDCTLSYTLCTIQFNYNSTDIFMNMRTEGNRRSKQSRIYTLPKGAEVTRLDDLDFPIYAVVDGYKIGPPPEIIKVYATWNEYYAGGDYYFPTTILLEPVEGMSGTDYPTCLYKSSIGCIKREDFIRITDGNWMSGDGITVLDAPTIAASEHYRTINVRVQDDKSPDDQDATFIIETVPNDSVDDSVTAAELSTNVEKIHFFNTTTAFAPSITVNRSAIDPMFYETLWQTYDKAPILESITEEPLYFINFSINDYPKVIPIYNGQTLSFSDSLTHAADGIRSNEIFYVDGKTPNIINMQAPTKHKYKVKFKVDYEVYKDVYIITSDDIPSGYK